jgi:hypothetical protein
MSDAQIQGSEFPIYYTGPMSRGTAQGKIGCICPTAQAVIKALQPHHRGNAYRLDPLWQIYEIDRIDKHRSLTLCEYGSKDDWVGFIRLPDSELNFAEMPAAAVTPGELVKDAIVMRYVVIPIDDERDVKMQPALKPQIAFGNAGPAELEPVIPTLGGLCDFVSDAVFAQLTKFL